MSSPLPSRYVEVQVIVTLSAHSIDVVRPQEPKSLPDGRYLLVPVEDAGRLVDREAIDYEALAAWLQENFAGYRIASRSWLQLAHDLVDAAIGVTDERP